MANSLYPSDGAIYLDSFIFYFFNDDKPRNEWKQAEIK